MSDLKHSISQSLNHSQRVEQTTIQDIKKQRLPSLTDFHKSAGTPTEKLISPLAEDLASFAKNIDSIQDIRSGGSLKIESKTMTTDSLKVS